MKKIIICVVFLIVIFIGSLGISFSTTMDSKLVLANINYEESVEVINNPERGFYRTGIAWFEKDGANHTGYTNAPLVHLRVSMGYYNNVNGENDISDAAINGLSNILNTYRNNNTVIILRFSYGDSANMEPSIEQVLRHVEQLGPIFTEYQDIIMSVDTGLLGPWGEQHSSSIVTQENINKLVNAFLENTPSDMQIAVRRPSYFAGWAGITYNDLHSTFEYLNSDAYRVGVYNDGYLGSHSDLGTFLYHNELGWRVNEVTWLSNHATHTYYGGEVVDNYTSNGFDYTSGDFMMEEMFKTHTTYLNYEWDQRTIDRWKSTTYSGDNSLYEGLSAYDYINNHLGYRYVVRESYLSDYVYLNDGNFLRIKGVIENVGAANLIKSKKVNVILSDGTNEYSYEVDFDFTKILSRDKYEYDFTILLDSNIVLGDYSVYLKVSDDYNEIEFANVDIWNDSINANKIGEVVITNRDTFEVFINNISNGNIVINDTYFFAGDTVSFDIVSDEGFEMIPGSLKIISNGIQLPYNIVGNTCNFKMPLENVNIEVLFDIIEIDSPDEPDTDEVPEVDVIPDEENQGNSNDVVIPDENDDLLEDDQIVEEDDQVIEENDQVIEEDDNQSNIVDEEEVKNNSNTVLNNIIISTVFVIVLGLIIGCLVFLRKKRSI